MDPTSGPRLLLPSVFFGFSTSAQVTLAKGGRWDGEYGIESWKVFPGRGRRTVMPKGPVICGPTGMFWVSVRAEVRSPERGKAWVGWREAECYCVSGVARP